MLQLFMVKISLRILIKWSKYDKYKSHGNQILKHYVNTGFKPWHPQIEVLVTYVYNDLCVTFGVICVHECAFHFLFILRVRHQLVDFLSCNWSPLGLIFLPNLAKKNLRAYKAKMEYKKMSWPRRHRLSKAQLHVEQVLDRGVNVRPNPRTRHEPDTGFFRLELDLNGFGS